MVSRRLLASASAALRSLSTRRTRRPAATLRGAGLRRRPRTCRSHRLPRAAATGSTSASFRRIGLPPCLGSLSMRTVTTCSWSSANVTVPVRPSRADAQVIRTRTPTRTPESSKRGKAASLAADRHVEQLAPDADRAHRRPTVSPRAGRRRWPHSVHPSHSGSSRWDSSSGEEPWSSGVPNISSPGPSSAATAPLGIRACAA